MGNSRKTGIYKILQSRGFLKESDFKQLVEDGAENPIRAIARLGYEKEHIIDHLVFATRVQYIDPRKVKPDYRLADEFPEKMVRKYNFFPEWSDESSISIILADPTDIEATQQIEFLTGKKVKVHFTDLDRIKAIIDELYNPMKTVAALNEEAFSKEIEDDISISDGDGPEDINDTDIPEIIEKPIVQLVNTVFADAIKKRASDIHIEPMEHQVEIRYRLDGDLHEMLQLPKKTLAPMISRIKILAKLDISMTRIPQDGKLRVKRQNSTIEMRVSTLPTNYGEKAVVRILDPSMTRLPLSELGFPLDVETPYKTAISQHQGMVIVTGPTGSGKTTTLHSSLNWLKSPKKNIVTIEDPIEYQQPGLNQTQVNRKAGLDFATTLRSILRQDPDIVLVGEIRDLETVQIAIRAALTGHMLLSTLHTNSATAAITRFEDIGVPRYLIASALTSVLAQRLMKKICPVCKEKVKIETLSREEQEFLRRQKVKEIWHGTGCDSCRGTGYKGRTGIYELLIVDGDISELISRGASELEILRFAVKRKNMRTLFLDGLMKLRDGETTLEQMREVVGLRDPLESSRNIDGISFNTSDLKGDSDKKIQSFLSGESIDKLESNTFHKPPPLNPMKAGHSVRNVPDKRDRNLVIIVDDDPLIRKMVKTILEGQGFKVVQAEDGEQGLKMVEQYHPGLIILDVRMPVMNGFEFLKKLRGDIEHQAIPVIMLTAEVEESRELFALDVGADDYIRKPFNPTLFLARVNAIVRRSNIR